MKLIILFGPQAVGKMTVGQELEKLTGLKLFHNHMTIELVTPFFSYGSSEGKRLVSLFRQEIFEAVANSSLPGLIFTFVWSFNQQADWDYLERVSQLFESKGATVYWVELEADVNERLERNISPNRLLHKPSKRNTEWSERDLLETMKKHRLNSYEGELNKEHYLRIHTTRRSAEETASLIKDTFRL
ncbi:AAA family ATPase [Paenibacillus hodogayensis]|uniref:AAA family ATPase n=1 Tax=Paenibacillus hodogayensis TaxID=279208 RepID=A0ABV5W4C5_9BACL